jgi:hypothetical protein
MKMKLSEVKKRNPIYVDVFARRGEVFIISLDDSISASFLYSAYLRAKEKGLKADLMYARHINEDWLPEEIRKAGKKLLYGILGEKEIELLRSCNITEYIFTRW